MLAMVTLSRMIVDETSLEQDAGIDMTNTRRVAAGFEKRIWASERLIDRIENDGERFDRYLQAIPELGDVATKLEGVMESVDGILGKDVGVGSTIDRIFWHLLMLIIVFFAAMLVAGVLFKIAARRLASEASQS